MWVDEELIAGAAVACAGTIPAPDPTTTPATNNAKTTNRREYNRDLGKRLIGDPTSPKGPQITLLISDAVASAWPKTRCRGVSPASQRFQRILSTLSALQ